MIEYLPWRGAFAALMYHRLAGPGTLDPYDVEPAQFEGHLAALAKAKIRGVSLADAARHVGRFVVLTFDDGNATDYEIALPLLLKFGFTATFFVSTAHTGTNSQWLDWRQMRALHAAGMQVGTHGHTHRFLDQLDEVELARELDIPRQLMADNADIKTSVMSCPGGRFNARTLRAAHAADYSVVATSVPAMGRFGPVTPELVPRFAVQSHTSVATVLDLARGNPRLLMHLGARYVARRSIRCLMGNRIYQTLWERRYTRSRVSAE